MATATAYLDRVLPAIDRLGERFAALVTSAPDPAAPIPDSEWTVRDATAHVVSVARRYIDGPEGRGTWVSSRNPRLPRDRAPASIEANTASSDSGVLWYGTKLVPKRRLTSTMTTE